MIIYYVCSITNQYNIHVNTGTYMIDLSVSILTHAVLACILFIIYYNNSMNLFTAFHF